MGYCPYRQDKRCLTIPVSHWFFWVRWRCISCNNAYKFDQR